MAIQHLLWPRLFARVLATVAPWPEAVPLMRPQISPGSQYFFSFDRAHPALVALKPIPPAKRQLHSALSPGRRCRLLSTSIQPSHLFGARHPCSPGLKVRAIQPSSLSFPLLSTLRCQLSLSPCHTPVPVFPCPPLKPAHAPVCSRDWETQVAKAVFGYHGKPARSALLED